MSEGNGKAVDQTNELLAKIYASMEKQNARLENVEHALASMGQSMVTGFALMNKSMEIVASDLKLLGARIENLALSSGERYRGLDERITRLEKRRKAG